jgi:hypothetical protein
LLGFLGIKQQDDFDEHVKLRVWCSS